MTNVDRNYVGQYIHGIGPPVFMKTGPAYYDRAYVVNRKWAKDGPYGTILSGGDEITFQNWLTTNNIHHSEFDPTAVINGYDMRGYWKNIAEPQDAGPPPESTYHGEFMKYYTPYSPKFFANSIYASASNPLHWHGSQLLDDNTKQIQFSPIWNVQSSPLTMQMAKSTPPKDNSGTGSAVTIMEGSRVDKRSTTKGLMGDDLDLQAFTLYVSKKLRLKAIDQVMDATINRTLLGASTVTFELDDSDREILQSGVLHQMLDIQLDGLWFRLVQVSKDEGDTLSLTFETREISVLRLYNKRRIVSRSHMTRARFILDLVKEVSNNGVFPKIPVVIPELNEIQLVEGSTSPVGNNADALNNQGIPTDLPPADDPIDTLLDPRRGLHAKDPNSPPRADQVSNVNTILGVASAMGARRKVMVCAIMTALQESDITNVDPAHSDPGSSGVFQQRPDSGWGTFEQGQNVAFAAKQFISRCITYDRDHPTATYNDLCQAIQGSAYPNAYGQWKDNAENWVTAYLLTTGKENALPVIPTSTSEIAAGGIADQLVDFQSVQRDPAIDPNSTTDTYYYYRGVPGAVTTANGDNNDIHSWGLEDSWTCIQRLANEVGWYAFFVGGTFWYVDGPTLFSMKPIMVVDEKSPGVDSISFDYDRGKKSATVTLKVRVGRWLAQPGAVVQLAHMGPVNGKWLVAEFSRSLFDLTATVTLQKPMPELPEPKTNISAPTGITAPPAPGVSVVVGGTGVVPTGPCIEMAKDVAAASHNGKLKMWNSGGQQDVDNAAKGLPCADGTSIDCNVWKVMLYLMENGFGPISSYALHSDHGPDGLGGHDTGFALDLNSTKGHDFGSDDPNGANILATAKFLRDAPPEVRPHGMIITGWNGTFHDEAAKLCIPEGSYYGNGPTGFNWSVSPESHANHIHICYTPGIPQDK